MMTYLFVMLQYFASWGIKPFHWRVSGILHSDNHRQIKTKNDCAPNMENYGMNVFWNVINFSQSFLGSNTYNSLSLWNNNEEYNDLNCKYFIILPIVSMFILVEYTLYYERPTCEGNKVFRKVLFLWHEWNIFYFHIVDMGSGIKIKKYYFLWKLSAILL